MSTTVPTGFKGFAISYSGGDPGASGITINGKPAFANYTSPEHGPTHLHGNWGPAPTPTPTPTPALSNAGDYKLKSGSSSSSAHPMSAEFIEDTYDPELGYERYDSPGDNPYISNYTPPQFGYMNDPSTLSPEELAYREGNIQGLDDRQNSVENAGAFLNKYLLDNNLFKEEVNKTPEMKVGTIGNESDDESDELYGRSYKESPYDKYDSSKYY